MVSVHAFWNSPVTFGAQPKQARPSAPVFWQPGLDASEQKPFSQRLPLPKAVAHWVSLVQSSWATLPREHAAATIAARSAAAKASSAGESGRAFTCFVAAPSTPIESTETQDRARLSSAWVARACGTRPSAV